jgi:hypothetical protein
VTGAAKLACETAERLPNRFSGTTFTVGKEGHLEACKAGADGGSEDDPIIAQ